MPTDSTTRLRLSVLSFVAAALGGVSGCVAQAEATDGEAGAEPMEALSADLPASTNVVTRQTISDAHCSFSVGTAQSAGTLPPQYFAWAYRTPLDSLCPGTAGYQVLGYSYGNVPNVQIIESASSPKLTAAYDFKVSPSGSAAVFSAAVQLDYTTLAPIKTASLGAQNPGYAGYVYLTKLKTAGPHLWVEGTASGTIPGQTGSGPNYEAFYRGWFTNTNTTPTSVTRD